MIKLARVTLLAPAVLLVSLWVGRDIAEGSKQLRRVPTLPWFIVAFLALIALNSFLAVPAEVSSGALTGAKTLLLLAVTAAAMRSRLDIIMTLGWRAFIPVACATLGSFVAALLVAAFLLP